MTKYLTLASALLVALVLPVSAQSDNSAYLESVKADVESTAGKMLDLAGAFDEEQYMWRPADGILSLGEVLNHVIMANNGMSGALGGEGIAEMPGDGAGAEAMITALEASKSAVLATLDGLSDADLGEMVSIYGTEMSRYQVLGILAGHLHEHLGQGIAYARSVGVVPPWSQ